MDLVGRRIVVTGGAGGIGAGTARALASAGADVAIFDVDDDRGAALARAVSNRVPGSVRFFHCDVSRRTDVFATFSTVADAFGGVDVLVAIAGIQVPLQLAEDISEETWDYVHETNTKGVLYTNQAACLYMKAQKYGKIINFASYAAVNGLPGSSPYAASKGAIVSWSKTIAREWSRYGIRVNVVNPVGETDLRHRAGSGTRFEPDGPVPTSWALSDSWYGQRVLIPGASGIKGDPALDIGPVIAFLSSPDSDYIAGQVLNVDGGLDMTR